MEKIKEWDDKQQNSKIWISIKLRQMHWTVKG